MLVRRESVATDIDGTRGLVLRRVLKGQHDAAMPGAMALDVAIASGERLLLPLGALTGATEIATRLTTGARIEWQITLAANRASVRDAETTDFSVRGTVAVITHD